MKKLNGRTIVFAAVLVAMNLVLSRVLAINIGPTIRITISATPIYLASLWFGPGCILHFFYHFFGKRNIVLLI